jgi:hypothetical protein
MIPSDALPAVDRRTLIRSAILLVGGSLAGVPDALFAATAPDPVEDAKAKPSAKRFFTPAEFAIVAEVADIIIPRTDTPGAKDAGVPKALDALMVSWASEERKAEFRALVAEFGATGLLKQKRKERLETVRRIDAEKMKAWHPPYVKFKDLVMTLYYLSEAGATKELRYELIPGKWEPWTEIGTDARAWAV